MNKFLLFLVFVPFFASCTKSNEEKIASAFKDYASNNFDDPSTLEIVSIEIKDTIDLKQMLDEMVLMSDSSSKLMSTKTDEVISLCDKYGRRLNNIPGFRERWADYMQILEDGQTSRIADVVSILSELDSKSSSKSDSLSQEDRLIESTVKYRVRESGDLKLKTLNIYNDLQLNSVLFSEKDEAPTKYKKFQQQVSILSSLIQENSKVINGATELIDFINENMR